jgi:homoserine O-acetyltransferase/O-succinyltransferase
MSQQPDLCNSLRGSIAVSQQLHKREVAMKQLCNIVVSVAAASAVPAFAHQPDQPAHQIAELGEMRFEKGGVLKNLKMSYVTHGKLNAAKDNAILLLHGFAANHHNFDHLIGPGKAFDPARYYIICPDSLGVTQTGYEHSSSPTSSGLKMTFPIYNIRDLNQATHKLITEKLGISHLVLVSGISGGAGQTVQYAITHPTFMDTIVPVVGGALRSTHSFLLSTFNSSIESCDGWKGGDYDTNPKTCATNAILQFAPFFYTREWWDQNADTPEAFGKWRKYWGPLYFDVQDARDLHYRMRANGEGWVGDTPGFKDVNTALAAIKAKTLFIYSPQDAFLGQRHIDAQVKVIPGARAVAVDSPAGHLICCGDDPAATQALERAFKEVLSGTSSRSQAAN